MSRRFPVIVLLGALAFSVACTNKKVNNPLANVGSKQPDKVLFDRAMDAMKHNRFDVARMTLQTLINTYPDSEFIARAKLAVGDSWYAEGGTAALTQAEIEYKDFETFFPNMPEAAEAQLKIANIQKPSSGCLKCRRCWETGNSKLAVFTSCASLTLQPLPGWLPWWSATRFTATPTRHCIYWANATRGK